jgi:transcriptional regulator with XRE-family HTH domain
MNRSILISFGNRVKQLRINHDLSQEKLAEITGFHRTYIGLVENGKRNLSLSNIQKFAKAFDITIIELFEGV